MDNRKLFYFLKVCETGSMAKAADCLFISQQALSKAIENLETELSVPLFIRSPKGLALTQYGKTLQKEAWELEKHQEKIVRRIAAMRDEQEQTVSISFYSGMLLQFPKGFFEHFIALHPEARFHFFSYPDDAHGRQFANTDVDLFISTTPLPNLSMRLAYEMHVPLFLLISCEHPLARRESVHMSDLRGERILCIDADFEAQNHVRRLCEAYGIQISSVLSDAEQQFSYYLVRSGRAVAFFAGPQSLLPEGTRRLPIEDAPITWSCYIYERTFGISSVAGELRDAIIAFRQMHQSQMGG